MARVEFEGVKCIKATPQAILCEIVPQSQVTDEI